MKDKEMIEKGKQIFLKYREAILYLFFGGVTTLTNIVVYALCIRIVGLPNLLSNGIALAASILLAYVTNKRFVFESRTDTWQALLREFASFLLCRAATGAFDMIFMYVTVDRLGWMDVLMKILSNVVVILLNFILSKLVIFKKKA